MSSSPCLPPIVVASPLKHVYRFPPCSNVPSSRPQSPSCWSCEPSLSDAEVAALKVRTGVNSGGRPCHSRLGAGSPRCCGG
eukprot:366544-Chlamydomonas_euryale.AAC.8